MSLFFYPEAAVLICAYRYENKLLKNPDKCYLVVDIDQYNYPLPGGICHRLCIQGQIVRIKKNDRLYFHFGDSVA